MPQELKETEYEAGSLVQQSYNSAPGSSLPALSFREVWRGGDGWRGRMEREVTYWDSLLTNYRTWKEGGTVPAPYADMFVGYSKGAGMLLDITLEDNAHAVGNPAAMRVMWIESVLENLNSLKWFVLPAAAVGILNWLLLTPWVGYPVLLASAAVIAFWLLKISYFRRRLVEYKREQELSTPPPETSATGTDTRDPKTCDPEPATAKLRSRTS